MTPENFKNFVDIYSADLSRWPVDQVKPALALMAQDEKVKDYFDQALALDDQLRSNLQYPLRDTTALEARIMAAITAKEQTADPAFVIAAQGKYAFGFKARFLFVQSGGMLAVAVLGFLLGFQPRAQAESVFDPIEYAQMQIIDDTQAIYNGDVF